jgi:ketosteroid isomerase-like protein
MFLKTIAMSMLSVSMSIAAVAQVAQPAKKVPSVETRIASLVSTWFDAEKQNDLNTLDRLIGDDFVGTTFAGTLIAKSDLVTEDRGANQWAGGELQGVEVRSFGDTAAVIGTIVLKNLTLRFTEVWTKRPQGWQMVVAHLSSKA